MSRIERVELTRSAGRPASLDEALKALMNLAPRRVVLGSEADGLDLKTQTEMAADAHTGLDAAMKTAAAEQLFVVPMVMSSDMEQRLDDMSERVIQPPFDVTAIFMPGFEGAHCPLFVVTREAGNEVSLLAAMPLMNAEGFYWGVSGFEAGTEELRRDIMRMLLATIDVHKLKPFKAPKTTAAVPKLIKNADRQVSPNEARRALTEQPISGFHVAGEANGNSVVALRIIQQAAREARTGRLFVIENMALSLVELRGADSRDAIVNNGALRPPFVCTFILASIESISDVYLELDPGFRTIG